MGLKQFLFGKNPKPDYLMVSLSDINYRDGSRIDINARDFYIKLVESGQEVEPIILKRVAGSTKYGVSDGHNRCFAFEKLGRKDIPAKFAQRTVETIHVQFPPFHEYKDPETYLKCGLVSDAEMALSTCEATNCEFLDAKNKKCKFCEEEYEDWH